MATNGKPNNLTTEDLAYINSMYDFYQKNPGAVIAHSQGKSYTEEAVTVYTPNFRDSLFEPKNPEAVTISPILIDSLVAPDGPSVNWLWHGYVGKGLKTEIASFPKAGKTTLLSYLLLAFQADGEFLGQQVKKSKVWVISEEPAVAWTTRRDALGLTNFFVSPKPLTRKPTRREWEDILHNLVAPCKKHQIDLLIIDTLSEFWSVNKENDANETKDALRPLNVLLNENIAVVCVHHAGHAGDREGGSSRGSTAITGDFDIIVDFKRYESDNDDDCRRILKGTMSRFGEDTPKNLVGILDADGYKKLGTKQEVAAQERHNTIIQILTDGKKRLTIKALIESSGMKRGVIYKSLQELKRKGFVDELNGYGETNSASTFGITEAVTDFYNTRDSLTKNEPKEAVIINKGIYIGNHDSLVNEEIEI